MAETIDIILGFNLAKKSPLDDRMRVANATARLALKWVYKGLVVMQLDEGKKYLYIGDEVANNSGTWVFITNTFSGSSIPDNALGFIDDIYIRDTGSLYRKTGTTTWTLLFNLVGSQIYTGTTDPPDNSIGANGDIFYVNVSGVTKLYRKEAGAWVYKFNISGVNGTSTFMYIAYADAIDGTGYILVASNDSAATLDPPDSTKRYIAFLVTPTSIGLTISQTNFVGKWSRYAGDGNRWTTVSSTSATIGLGTLSITVEQDLAWTTGQRFVLAVPGDPTKTMEGDTVSYNPTTGAFVGDVITTKGTGTYSSWTLSLQASLPDATEIAFSNTDVDTGTESVDELPLADAKRVDWDYYIVKGANSTGGRISVAINGTTLTGEHNPMVDIGTIDVTLDVDISAGAIRLRATATSDNWTVKGLRRVIA